MLRSAAPAALPDWLPRALELLQAARHAELAALCQDVLARDPRHVDATRFLAAALLAVGDTPAGIAQLRRATTLAPASHDSHFTLGNVLAASGDFDGALASFRRTTELRPRLADAWNARGQLLKALSRYDESEACCRAGLQACPGNTALQSTLSAVLFEQGRVDQAIDVARDALSSAPAHAAVHSDLLRMMNYADHQDPAAVWQEHRQWNIRHAAHLSAAASTPDSRPDPQRRLRIGFVSPYFRRHAVTFFLEPVIEHHDPAMLEIILYADVARPDEYSSRLQSYGAIWRKTTALTDEQLAAQVRADAVDILVDLSGHTPGNRLLAFARKPAPLQVTWNGYPNTTGLHAIDYRITDAFCDPPDTTEQFHAEALWRLPQTFMTWRIPEAAPPVSGLPALTNGHITFGSFNSCYKLSETVIALWSQVLQRVAGARLKLWTVDGAAARAHVLERFRAGGIDAGRLDIVGRVSHDEFLQAHHSVDIALDSFPYHGTTTTCFSLWMGLPVVTLAGTVHAGRVGVSLLNNAGMPELVAQTPQQYVDIAVDLSGDPGALAQRRQTMRDRLRGQPLTDGADGARQFEQAARKMWANYCAAQSGQAT